MISPEIRRGREESVQSLWHDHFIAAGQDEEKPRQDQEATADLFLYSPVAQFGPTEASHQQA